mgnify:CR=1 FL=1
MTAPWGDRQCKGYGSDARDVGDSPRGYGSEARVVERGKVVVAPVRVAGCGKFHSRNCCPCGKIVTPDERKEKKVTTITVPTDTLDREFGSLWDQAGILHKVFRHLTIISPESRQLATKIKRVERGAVNMGKAPKSE